MAIKTVLCYGDSNTFGYNNMLNPMRFERRWTRELQALLGNDYYVIEDGLPGRTACFTKAEDAYLCGCNDIFYSMNKHLPLDMIIIMLGTNDHKHNYHLSNADIVEGLSKCISRVKLSARTYNLKIPKIMLVAPAPINNYLLQGPFSDMFGKDSIKLSEELSKEIEALANKKGCLYMEAGRYITNGASDGVHLDQNGHIKLAELLAKKLREVL